MTAFDLVVLVASFMKFEFFACTNNKTSIFILKNENYRLMDEHEHNYSTFNDFELVSKRNEKTETCFSSWIELFEKPYFGGFLIEIVQRFKHMLNEYSTFLSTNFVNAMCEWRRLKMMCFRTLPIAMLIYEWRCF